MGIKNQGLGRMWVALIQKVRWELEFASGIRFEIEYLDHSLQIERTVDMREKVRGEIRTGFPTQYRSQARWIDLQQYQALLTGIKSIGYAQHLADFGTMDKALRSE